MAHLKVTPLSCFSCFFFHFFHFLLFLVGIEFISATYGKAYNGTTDEQIHDKRSLVLTARHSTSTSWCSDAPIILDGSITLGGPG